MSETPERLAEKCQERKQRRDAQRKTIISKRIKAGLARRRKSQHGMPLGFTRCLSIIKMASNPLALFYRPSLHICSVEIVALKPKPGTKLVGIYDPTKLMGKGRLWELEAMIREDLEEVVREAASNRK